MNQRTGAALFTTAIHSHLNAINGFSSHLKHQLAEMVPVIEQLAPQLLDGREVHFAQRIQANSKELLRLFATMLDLERISAGERLLIQTEVIDLAGLLQEVRDECAILYPSLVVELPPSARASLTGDARRLAQILVTILLHADLQTPAVVTVEPAPTPHIQLTCVLTDEFIQALAQGEPGGATIELVSGHLLKYAVDVTVMRVRADQSGCALQFAIDADGRSMITVRA